jgi:hypothetical protein
MKSDIWRFSSQSRNRRIETTKRPLCVSGREREITKQFIIIAYAYNYSRPVELKLDFWAICYTFANQLNGV